jgi:predicted DNA-binding transcriptional regulator AlpA
LEVAALAASARIKLEAGAFIDAAELAALVGLDPRTVHRQARERRYPSQQPTGPGGARRFSPEDVAAIRDTIASPARAA